MVTDSIMMIKKKEVASLITGYIGTMPHAVNELFLALEGFYPKITVVPGQTVKINLEHMNTYSINLDKSIAEGLMTATYLNDLVMSVNMFSKFKVTVRYQFYDLNDNLKTEHIMVNEDSLMLEPLSVENLDQAKEDMPGAERNHFGI